MARLLPGFLVHVDSSAAFEDVCSFLQSLPLLVAGFQPTRKLLDTFLTLVIAFIIFPGRVQSVFAVVQCCFLELVQQVGCGERERERERVTQRETEKHRAQLRSEESLNHR